MSYLIVSKTLATQEMLDRIDMLLCYLNVTNSGKKLLYCVAVISSVSIMLKDDPKNPKCFAEGRKDFTCFWEEDEEKAESVDQYSFKYNYQ